MISAPLDADKEILTSALERVYGYSYDKAVYFIRSRYNSHCFDDRSTDPHQKVDDYGFGGGPGMVLMPQPIFDAVLDLKKENSKVILLTPQGIKYNQK